MAIMAKIITYQEKLGNYNTRQKYLSRRAIITYQEKLGNYNDFHYVYDRFGL